MKNTNGYVYILSNPMFAGEYKIGMTKTHPEQRVKELSSDAGESMPFVVEYTHEVDNALKTEQALHRHFDKNRVNNKREFFNVDLVEIITKLKTY